MKIRNGSNTLSNIRRIYQSVKKMPMKEIDYSCCLK